MVNIERDNILHKHTHIPTIIPMVQWGYTGYNGQVTDSD